jgi:hypothetical protein
MRYIDKREAPDDVQADFNAVQETLCSGYFIFIDLFFWSMFLSIYTFSSHYSIIRASIIFTSFYICGLCLFLCLKKWVKDITF